MRVWSLKDGSLVDEIKQAHSNAVGVLCVLSNGDLASSDYDGNVKIWNTTDWKVKHSFRTELDAIWAMIVRDNVEIMGIWLLVRIRFKFGTRTIVSR